MSRLFSIRTVSGRSRVPPHDPMCCRFRLSRAREALAGRPLVYVSPPETRTLFLMHSLHEDGPLSCGKGTVEQDSDVCHPCAAIDLRVATQYVATLWSWFWAWLGLKAGERTMGEPTNDGAPVPFIPRRAAALRAGLVFCQGFRFLSLRDFPKRPTPESLDAPVSLLPADPS